MLGALLGLSTYCTDPVELNETNLLGTWRIVHFESSFGDPIDHTYEEIYTVEYEIREDKSFTITSSFNEPRSGTWELDKENREIHIKLGDDRSSVFHVYEFTGQRLRISYSVGQDTVYLTFEKQR